MCSVSQTFFWSLFQIRTDHEVLMLFDKIPWNISRISIILVKKSLYSNTFLGIFIFIKWYTSNRLSLACGSIKMYKELMNNKKINQNLLISFRWLFHIEDSEWILPLPERGTSRVRELLISVQMRPYNRQRIRWFQYSSLSEDLKRIRMYSSLCKICFIVWWFFFSN